MSVTPTLYATAVTQYDFGGTDAWLTDTDALGPEDTTVAQAKLGPPAGSGNFYSSYLELQTFKDAGANTLATLIPTGSTIDGVEMRFKRLAQEPGTPIGMTMQDFSIMMLIGGTAGESGDEKAVGGDWPASLTWSSWYGGPTDKWGNTLTRATVIAANFGVAICCTNVNADVGEIDGQVDSVEMLVYYTPPAGSPQRTLVGCGT